MRLRINWKKLLKPALRKAEKAALAELAKKEPELLLAVDHAMSTSIELRRGVEHRNLILIGALVTELQASLAQIRGILTGE